MRSAVASHIVMYDVGGFGLSLGKRDDLTGQTDRNARAGRQSVDPEGQFPRLRVVGDGAFQDTAEGSSAVVRNNAGRRNRADGVWVNRQIIRDNIPDRDDAAPRTL